MRSGLYLLLLGASVFMQAANATGDNLVIPGHVATASAQILPKRGISMERVLEKYGEPDKRYGPIGEPPITEWVYGSFRVYFEYEIVLHSIDLNTIILPKK
jgi:hypothetical protein